VIALLALSLGCGGAPEEVAMPAPAQLVATGALRPGGRPVAVVVRDGRIDAVLDDVAAAAAHVGPDTVRLDAPVLTAGFVDAHAHPQGLGARLATLDLAGIGTYAATLDAIRAAAASGEGWVVGRGWDQNDWADAPAGGWPLAADLDAAVGDRPALLRRVDGHAAWASGAALAAAGVDATTPDPPGGRLIRDAAGRPTGVLIDTALDLVAVPEPPEAEQRRRLRAAVQAIAEVGLTGVHAMGASDAELARYEALEAEGALPIRLWVYVDPGTEAAARLAATGPWGEGLVKVLGIKAYADGALGSRGALLSAPYTDEPHGNGLAITTAEALRELAITHTGAGAQLAVHAIGDQGVRNVLDAFAATREAHPERAGVRHRVEHAQVVHPDDIPRFAALGVIASMQPTHATSDMPWAEQRLGPERVRWAYAWRSLASAGAPLAFGSDFPVEEHAPALGLWAAARRTDLSGQPAGGWLPAEALGEDEAIAAFTAGAAYAAHEEARLGEVRVGAAADLTLWAPAADAPWRAVATVVGGRVVSTAR
jgi:predicted amidohydrolase YtcJ